MDFQASATGTASTWTAISAGSSGSTVSQITALKTGTFTLSIGGNPTGSVPEVENNIAIVRGVWHHLELDLNFNAQAATAYVDGALLGTGPFVQLQPPPLLVLTAGVGSAGTDLAYWDNVSVTAAPGITSVQNPASNILPLLPNYGIAQGSIMIIYGIGFGPTTLAEPSALPWPTSFAGTSVTVTQGSSVYNVPIIYVLNNQAGGYSQLAGIMPSNTTPGSATVQLTYNGTASPAFATTIVANNFGISTVNQTGTGAAAITTGSGVLITNANSAIPGNTYAMWGTGLGAATAGTPTPMPTLAAM